MPLESCLRWCFFLTIAPCLTVFFQMLNNRSGLMLLAAVGIVLAAESGCGRTERVAHYRAPKPLPIEAPAVDSSAGSQQSIGEPKDRMLGAIIPVGSQGWFFKLTGPKDAVAVKEADFMTLLKSVHFADDGKPQWTLPEGWRQQPGSDIRYATLVIGPAEGQDEKPLEVSVTVLPKSGDDESYALVNINRWRGQLKLPPIAKEQLSSESTQIELAAARATVVNLLGTESARGMGGGPFSRGAGDGK